MAELTHFSLCSGIGGLDLAAERAGFKTVAQCEIDEYASAVLKKRFQGVHNFGDIRTITNESVRAARITNKITVLSAGFPCQPYSLAGKGLGDGDERDLWGEVARTIGLLQPSWFVGENTLGLFARTRQRYFTRILADIVSLGYSVSWGVWGAYDVGANHRRNRLFLVAHTNSKRRHEKQYDARNLADGQAQRELSATISAHLPNALPVGLEQRREPPYLVEAERNRMGIQENDAGAWWSIEPELGRVAYGIPERVDRLRCLGNAVVPQQAFPIFEMIAEYENRSYLVYG